MKNKNDISDTESAVMVATLVASVVDSFVEELIEATEGVGGTIDSQQIQSIAGSFKETAESHSVLKECVERLVKHHRSADAESNREQALERVLIHRIEGVFPTKGDLGQGRQIVSRRALPGLFEAIKMLIGTDQFNTRAEVCNQVLASHRAQGKSTSDWAAIFKNQECDIAVDEVLTLFASHFEKLDDRVNWLIDQINERLAPADKFAYKGGGVSTWVMDKPTVQMILRGLFARFYLRLAEPDGRES